MKLPAEWEAIASEWERCHGSPCRYVAERCYTLANKPPKELTDAEIVEVIRAHALGSGLPNLIKDAFAAYHRKQSEPERVKFRAARHPDGSVHMFIYSGQHIAPFEWLEPEQSFEVTLP